MSNICLEAKTKEQEILKKYLEDNASDVLTDKINNGVKIEKDGKTVINKKTLDTFMKYATEEAKKLAEKGATSAMVEDRVVFGWLIHYFEESDIIGILYNEDGTEYKKPITKASTTPTTKYEPPKPVKKGPELISMFDNIDDLFSTNTEEEQEIEPEEPVEEKIEPKISPIYQRYLDIQNKYPDYVIAIRLGDFLEIFGDNAVKVGNRLEMTIVSRDFGLDNRVPMIGFPCHADSVYINKIQKDFSVVTVDGDDIKIYNKLPVIVDVNTDTGEIIEETVFDPEIVAKLYGIFGDVLEGY